MKIFECNQRELSGILGVSQRRIRQLIEEGVLTKAEMRYDISECVQRYIEFKINTEIERKTPGDYDKERAEHERAKKEITKLKLRKMRRELHEAADVEGVVGDMLIRFRSKLLAMPPKLAPQLIGVTEANEMMSRLKQDVLEALDELSEYNPDDYSDVMDDESEDDEEAAEDPEADE